MRLTVAKEACTQKFSKVRSLGQELLGTGNTILAEATSNDSIWGIGAVVLQSHAGLTVAAMALA